MVDVAQLVRALVCGTRGRGFESHLPPTTIQKPLDASLTAFFVSAPSQTCLSEGADAKKDEMRSITAFGWW